MVIQTNFDLIVLHPYYKMDYIELEWGGAKEQAEEIDVGNPNAKNWHEEEMNVLEATVRK